MPFGLSRVPYAFIKLMKPVMAWLRLRGLLSVIYLDDILCIAESYEECLANVNLTICLLKHLGFVVNEKKRSLTPSRSCKFLGFIINSCNLTLKLTEERKEKLLTDLRCFQKKEKCKIVEFAQILRKLVAACPGVKYGWMYTKIWKVLN